MAEIVRRCPDCGVEMEQMKTTAGGQQLRLISDENTSGILGSLGVKQRYGADAFVCSECGLTRLYADLEE